jgi:cytochrome bd ubiquinol oxidase subunit II
MHQVLGVGIPFIAAGVLAFTVLAYAVLDGTDLGVGLLFVLERGTCRDVMANSILPVWDANETWLVLGGGGLIAMFPVAYSVILSALYPTVVGMLLALIFRGVALEYRSRASGAGRRWWDRALMAGSVLAALCQGITLGALVQGIRVEHDAYAGGWLDWLTSFSVLCGVTLLLGYGLLGACWVAWRTEGELQERSRTYARYLGVAMLALIVAASAWMPFLNATYRDRWLHWPDLLLAGSVPLLLAVLVAVWWRALARGRDLLALLAALGWFVLCFTWLGINLSPFIVPPSLTIPQAASAPSSQIFVLAGSAILIPAILAYSSYGFWVFRGKVSARSP